MPRVKICGLQHEEQAIAAAEEGADFIGLVFAESRRRISIKQARSMTRVISNLVVRPQIVGIFAGQDINEVNNIAKHCELDWVQLSGGEEPDYCDQVKCPQIKVFAVEKETTSKEVLKEMSLFLSTGADRLFMLDTQIKGRLGGTGESFDWQVAREISPIFPIIIAGGLNPENVGQMIHYVNPWGVDVSSGVETDGIKDINKIRSFIQKVKNFPR